MFSFDPIRYPRFRIFHFPAIHRETCANILHARRIKQREREREGKRNDKNTFFQITSINPLSPDPDKTEDDNFQFNRSNLGGRASKIEYIDDNLSR